MNILSEDIIHFFHKQSFLIVSTVDADGWPYSSCKGLVYMNENGMTYLLDLYRGKTYKNIKTNPRISITAVDEHKFAGYCLKGTAKTVPEGKIMPYLKKTWEERITSRVTKRVLKEIREEEGNSKYPELLLPKPEYMIVMKVKKVINLTPHPLK